MTRLADILVLMMQVLSLIVSVTVNLQVDEQYFVEFFEIEMKMMVTVIL
jgi:hypothetical protein